jgi:hypothetical protein
MIVPPSTSYLTPLIQTLPKPVMEPIAVTEVETDVGGGDVVPPPDGAPDDDPPPQAARPINAAKPIIDPISLVNFMMLSSLQKLFKTRLQRDFSGRLNSPPVDLRLDCSKKPYVSQFISNINLLTDLRA